MQTKLSNNIHPQMWSKRKRGSVIAALLLLLVLDRFSKLLALQTLTVDSATELVPGWFHLTLYYNQHIVFFLNLPLWLEVGIPLLLSVIVLAVALQEYRKMRFFSAAYFFLILIGAASNIFDRLKYDAVIDFMSVPFWSIFNFADIYIVVGAALLVISSWRTPTTDSKI